MMHAESIEEGPNLDCQPSNSDGAKLRSLTPRMTKSAASPRKDFARVLASPAISKGRITRSRKPR